MTDILNEDGVKQDSFRAWLLAARPKTLAGAAVPVMIGIAFCYADAQLYGWNIFSWKPALLCLLFALIMQIDANFINDFYDYARGNDDETRLGPKRACAQGWVSIDAMKKAIALTTVTACAVGLPLIIYGGLEMIAVGILCVVFCFLYTTHLSYIGLGDLLVVVFFGIVPVCITYYVQLHTITWPLFWASIACGLVIDNLLMINNFRDIQNDRKSGKITLVARAGLSRSAKIYLALGFIACMLNILMWTRDGRMWAFLLPLLYLIPHYLTWREMVKIKRGKALNKILGKTARNIFIYGLLTAGGIICSLMLANYSN